ncbi:MAG: AMP-binding protein [Candidatus Margulisbacteria bacterium]|jgi:long-chain acyl-CoA synthetase|nr:AMP-binding protein [Candidatus Margulisiibacteriota bacterium]
MDFYLLAQEITAKYSDKICFAERNLSYKDVWRLMQARAAFLKTHGFKAGDVVGILSRNSADWCLTFGAILALGAVVLVMDVNWSLRESREILKKVKAKAVYVSPEFSAADYSLTKHLLNSVDVEQPFLPDIQQKPDTIAALFYTSGSAGQPKIVALTHANLIHTALVFYREHLNINLSDTILAFLPFYHVYGLVTGFLGGYFNGAAIIFQNSPKSGDIIESLTKYPITIFAATPQIFEFLFESVLKKIKAQARLKYFIIISALHIPKTPILSGLLAGFFQPIRLLLGKKVRFFISGGAPLKPKYFYYYERAGFKLLEGYGLTETAAGFCGNSVEKPKPACVGKPFRGNFVKIHRPDTNGVGEIYLKGASVMAGYYHNPQANKEAFDPESWFATGDLGFLDKDDDLHITGRKKNVIVLDSGKNIYPEELEPYYATSKLIKELAVLGRRIAGREMVFAVIVPVVRLENCYQRVAEELARKSRRLSVHKKIKKFALSYEPLPRTSSGKIRLNEVSQNLDAGKYQTAKLSRRQLCL